MSSEYLKTHGVFDLTHHVQYLREVRIGDTVQIYVRLIGRSASAKRLHFMLFMVNTRTQLVASMLEGLAMHTDLVERKSSSFTGNILAKIDEMIKQHNTFLWNAPLCGSINHN